MKLDLSKQAMDQNVEGSPVAKHTQIAEGKSLLGPESTRNPISAVGSMSSAGKVQPSARINVMPFVEGKAIVPPSLQEQEAVVSKVDAAA